ncbi:MAG: protoporphyrinogen oxidase [Planctomycetota bacterium]
MSGEERLDVAVVGAGIFGMSLAIFLRDDDEARSLKVFEAAPRPGGTLGSTRRNGYVWEHGANGFLDNVPHTKDLAIRLGLEDRLQPAAEAARHRYLLRHGTLHPLPTSPPAFFSSRLLSLKGRLRVALEPLRSYRPVPDDQSVAHFARRHLGQEAADVLIDAMVSGIFGGDPERLSLPSAFPKMAALEREHGSLVRGMIRKKKEARRSRAEASGGPAGPGGRSHSFPSGLQELVDAAANHLGERLVVDTDVLSAELAEGGWRLRLEGAPDVIATELALCVPPHRAKEILAGDRELASLLEEIPAASIAVVGLGFERRRVAHPLDGFGFLRPWKEPGRILGCLFPGTCFPEHAPSDRVSLRVMTGGRRDPAAVSLSDDELLRVVLDDLRSLLGIEGDPEEIEIRRWPRGIPQYELGHEKRLARLDTLLETRPGLALGGNGYRGIGLNDCVRGARELADRLGRRSREA